MTIAGENHSDLKAKQTKTQNHHAAFSCTCEMQAGDVPGPPAVNFWLWPIEGTRVISGRLCSHCVAWHPQHPEVRPTPHSHVETGPASQTLAPWIQAGGH